MYAGTRAHIEPGSIGPDHGNITHSGTCSVVQLSNTTVMLLSAAHAASSEELDWLSLGSAF